MNTSFGDDKREYFRLPLAINVEYKFLTREISGSDSNATYQGTTSDLSAGGMLLQARLPDRNWLGDLLSQKRFMGMQIKLPNLPGPIRALCRVVWLSPVEDEDDTYDMGVEFYSITETDRDAVTDFIIRSYWPHPAVFQPG